MSFTFRRHWLTHWPFLSTTFLVLSVIAITFGSSAIILNDPTWWLVCSFATLLLIIFTFLQFWFFVQLRSIYHQLPRWLLSKGRISPEDQILYPYVSDSRLAHALIKHLSTGKFWLVDVYSPADMRSARTARSRNQDIVPEKDPRIKFIPGDIMLLPIQDQEIDVVVLTNVVQAITQAGDRERFLTEISRVMKPNGRILIFEPIRFTPRILVDPAANVQFWSKNELDQSLMSQGFSRIELQTPGGLTILGRATTPGRYENTQLPLEF